MELVIMRHGRIPANEQHRYAGVLDESLSARGAADARRAGVCPGVSRVYVSPRLRAKETAAICFPNAEQVVVDGLAEMNFGDFEGRSPDEMYGADRAYTAWVDAGCEGPCPHGESRASFTHRTAAAVESLLRDAAAQGEDRVVVVAHGGTVMAAFSSFAGPPPGVSADGYYSWRVDNCGGYRAQVRLQDGALRLVGYERFCDLGFLC